MELAFLLLAIGLLGALALLLWLLAARLGGPSGPRVTGLFIYPIKSCAETRLQAAKVTARGFEGDRLFQCSDAEGKFCTPREDDKARLFHVRPTLAGEGVLTLQAQGAREALTLDLAKVATKPVACDVLCAASKIQLLDYGDAVAEWLARATGISGVRLTGMPEGCDRPVLANAKQGDPVPTSAAAAPPPPVSLADEAPFLLTSTESLADLNRRLRARGVPVVDMRRFRPNIVISGLRAWEEDCLKRVRIDGVDFWAWQRCGRCKMTTIDRETLAHGPEPLATLSTFRERANGQRNFGMHLIPVDPLAAGAKPVCVGGAVEVLEFDEERRAEWQRLFGPSSGA